MTDSEFSLRLTDFFGTSFEFDEPRKLIKFLLDEEAFWNSQIEKIPEGESPRASINQTFNLASRLEDLRSRVQALEKNWASYDANSKKNQLQPLTRIARQLKDHGWLWRGHSACAHMLDLQIEYGADAVTAFKRVIRGEQPKLDSVNAFYGSLAAYEFVFQDSDLVKRRRGEKISIGRLKTELNKEKLELVTEFVKFKDEFKYWNEIARKRADRRLSAAKRLLEKKNRQFRKAFDQDREEWTKRFEELESAFRDLLRLEKPAEYWNRSAKKYRRQGGIWALLLTVVLAAGLTGGGAFFSTWLQGQAIGVSLDTVQGVTIFGVLVATYAYFVRVLSKLTFSSYHLMRDAEEREQLTYLYLSLSKDSEMDEKSRDLVLQSLFSRSDPGLIGSDSGPTLPSLPGALRSISGGKTN